ncbi:MAG: type IX secretion system membrane protein PorP/SprF [Flavobacteriales bacterium]|nr:type IX secretion system membrane protein PorP/SprF [Flavobacteriales bacterium]
MGPLRPLLFLLLAASWSGALAQDPQFTQNFAAPLYLNPALTGNTYQDRLILNYRKQWPGIAPGYDTYAVSYDHRASTLNSGFGLMAVRDVAGSNDLAFTMIAANYSYEAHIDRKHGLRGGLRLGYTRREFDPSTVLFADQVIRDNAPTSIEPPLIEQVHYFDAAVGLVYFGERAWAGASFSHINRPQQSLVNGGNTRLAVRTSVHGGYRFPLDGLSMQKSRTVLTAAAHYKAQDKWDQFDVGAYVEHKQLTGGIWYRGLPALKAYKRGYPNNDAVAVMVGYETMNQFTFVYSYDVTVSTLTMASAGSHEISITYEWPVRKKARRYRVVPCPKF